MVPGFDVESLNVLGKLIGKLERFNLEGAAPEEFEPGDLLDDSEQTFFCIRGLARFWEGKAVADFGQCMIDLVISAHNQLQTDLTLIMLGTPRKLSVFISLGTKRTTQTILEGIFPGVTLEPIATRTLMELLSPHFLIKGIVTGIPSNKGFSASQETTKEKSPQQNNQGHAMPSAAGGQSQSQLERVVRGMHGTTWGYVVQAHPRPRHKIVEERMKTIDLLTQVTNRSRVQWQSTSQENLQVTTIESGGKTQTFSGDMVNYRAQYLVRLLERELERFDQAAAAGQWTVRTYFGADTIDDAERLAALLLGTLAGTDSRPEPLRAMLCQSVGQSLDSFHTFLTSSEIATLIQLPREEVPGYAIHDYVRFDVDFHDSDAMALPLGCIEQNGRTTQNTFNISLEALAKHVVVIGVTGSGKTTTVMNLLDRVVDARKPFLVIEPAKTEYRSLHSALARRTPFHVYTLGNEMVAPFRLNPFEFETGDEPGDVPLLAHIDYLKAVFNAAFVLYSPMPQVLEEALHEVYEDKGWDLTSGTNRRVPDWQERHKYPIFPTLTDLYYKVEEVTNRLGYDQEIESNVKAGLKARIGSLRIGSKGLMLDTARSISMETLLSTPTVLELENIGNDDEKTFIMGLFLARLYEYRRLQAATNAAAKGLSSFGLKHLIVFEEAHRLLQNTSTQVGTEAANPRAQAIEAFTNMLSEMRAYGQGVLVAEQIPSKLAPDVLKNTNLKIVHRLIAQDDRQSIGQTMNLNEEQLIHLGVLTPGMAAVYAEGADHAYLVRMENYKRNLSALIDRDLKLMSRKYASVKPFQALLDLDKYNIPSTQLGGPEPAIYHAAGKLLDSEKSRWLWSSVLLRLISQPDTALQMLTHFSEYIEAEMPHLLPDQHNAVLLMWLVLGSAEVLHKRGAQFGWTYAQVEELRTLLTYGLVGAARVYTTASSEVEIDSQTSDEKHLADIEQAGEYLAQFVQAYTILVERRQGPFAGCVHCQAKCLYRSDVSTLLELKDMQWISDELASSTHPTMEERYSAVAKIAISIARQWLGSDEEEPLEVGMSGIGYCAVLHAARTGFNEYEQAQIGDSTNLYLLDTPETE